MEARARKSLTLLRQGLQLDATAITSSVFQDIILPQVSMSDMEEAPYMEVISSFSGCPYKTHTGKTQSKTIVSELLHMIHEKEDAMRNAAYVVLKRASGLKSAEQLVEAGIIPVLLERLLLEVESNQVLILEILQSCCALNVNDALDADAMSIIAKLLKHPSSVIRICAINVVNILCAELRGKSEACEFGVSSVLSELLIDGAYEVQIKALETILIIAQDIPGTLISSAQNLFGKLSKLLHSKKRELKINALKVFATLVHSQRGKTFTLLYTEQILLCTHVNDPDIRKTATDIINALKN